MKPNQKNRYNGRYNNRGSRTVIYRNTALESTGPLGKLHGTALQLFEKYQTAAKDALIQNDAVLAQTFMQFADHYMRLQNQAIANEQALRQNQQRPQQSAQEAVFESPSETGRGDANDAIPTFDVPSEPETEDSVVSESKSETEGQSEPKKNTHMNRNNRNGKRSKQDVTESVSDKMDLSIPVAQLQ